MQPSCSPSPTQKYGGDTNTLFCKKDATHPGIRYRRLFNQLAKPSRTVLAIAREEEGPSTNPQEGWFFIREDEIF